MNRRVVGALIGKLGVPIPTSIAQSSLSEAYELCQDRGLRADNPKLLPLKLGVEYKVRSAFGQACFSRQDPDAKIGSLPLSVPV